MNTINRFDEEVLTMNNYNVSIIYNKIKDIPELKSNLNNEEKSIKGMYSFIFNKAKTMAVNNVAMVKDQIVFNWAVEYFKKTNEELGIKVTVSQEANTEKDSDKKASINEETENSQISLFQEV